MAERLTSRKKQAQKMRDQIQSVALDLFDKEGFENVSVEQIAQTAGCSVGNIYHYFKGKDELALQVTGHVDTAYLELEKNYDSSSLTAKEKLLDFVEQALAISSQEELLYKSFIHSLKYPEQGVLKTKEDREYFRILRKLIEACQVDGSIGLERSCDDILRELVVLHRGMLFQWRIEEGSFDLVQSGRIMAEYLLRK